MGQFHHQNETAGWQEAATPLVLDLDAFRLGDTALGDAADELAVLGPGRPGARAGVYVFPAHGLAVELADGRLRAVTAYFRPTGDAGLFRGTVWHRERAVDPAAMVGEPAVVARFGEPAATESIEIAGWDARRVLTYRTAAVEWGLLMTADGRVMEINIYAQR